MLVADSGSGKLGAMKVFSQEVTKIQKEEMAVYDQSASAKDPSPTKRMKKDPSTSPVFHKNCCTAVVVVEGILLGAPASANLDV